MIDFDRFWADPDEDESPEEPAPGVTPEAIAAWEATHGVRLPEPLRSALLVQDGGPTRFSTEAGLLTVNSLDEIRPVDDDFWEFYPDDDAEDGLIAPDHALVFEWGLNHGGMIFNFNAAGPRGEPSILTDYHGETLYFLADTLAAYLAAEFGGATGEATAAEVRAIADHPAASVPASADPQAEALGRLMSLMPADEREALIKLATEPPAPDAISDAFLAAMTPEQAEAVRAARQRFTATMRGLGPPSDSLAPEQPGRDSGAGGQMA